MELGLFVGGSVVVVGVLRVDLGGQLPTEHVHGQVDRQADRDREHGDCEGEDGHAGPGEAHHVVLEAGAGVGDRAEPTSGHDTIGQGYEGDNQREFGTAHQEGGGESDERQHCCFLSGCEAVPR